MVRLNPPKQKSFFKGQRALEVSQNLADTFIKVMIISNLLMVLILKL